MKKAGKNEKIDLNSLRFVSLRSKITKSKQSEKFKAKKRKNAKNSEKSEKKPKNRLRKL